MFKFAHISDVHADFMQYGIEARRQDFTKAFQWQINKAIEERVNIIVIAGDLFHHRINRHVTVYEIEQCLQKAKSHGIIVVSIIGNHDLKPYRDGLSIIDKLALNNLIERPQHDAPLIYNFDGPGLVADKEIHVWGLDWQGAKTQRVMTDYISIINKYYESNENESYGILMVHAGIAEDLNEYDTSAFSLKSLDDVAGGRINYVALGHVHAPKMRLDTSPIVVQPGSSETNSLNELPYMEESGMVVVTVDEFTFGTELETFVTPKRPFIYLQIDVTNLVNLQDLNKVIRHKLAEVVPYFSEDPIFKIKLTGQTSLDIDKGIILANLPVTTLNNDIIMNQTSKNVMIAEAVEAEQMTQEDIEVDAIRRIFGDSYEPTYVLGIKNAALAGSTVEELTNLI